MIFGNRRTHPPQTEENTTMVHQVKESAGGTSYVISSYGTWRPGAYATATAARYAFQFRDEELQQLQESVNPGGVITIEMLKALKAASAAQETV